jgi:hypothetical protein
MNDPPFVVHDAISVSVEGELAEYPRLRRTLANCLSTVVHHDPRNETGLPNTLKFINPRTFLTRQLTVFSPSNGP